MNRKAHSVPLSGAGSERLRENTPDAWTGPSSMATGDEREDVASRIADVHLDGVQVVQNVGGGEIRVVWVMQ